MASRERISPASIAPGALRECTTCASSTSKILIIVEGTDVEMGVFQTGKFNSVHYMCSESQTSHLDRSGFNV